MLSRAPGKRSSLPPAALMVLVSALLVGGYLRFRGLGGRGLWTDELVSWWAVSSGSLRDMLTRCASCMATPPLALVAERVSWLALGKSEWALRLPSVLAGTGTIAVVFFAGVRMFGAEAACVASLLLAIHPAHIGFSSEARPYAIAGLFAALSVWAWSELMRSDRRRWIAVYAVSTAALLYTQFVFLPLVAAQIVGLLLGRRAGGVERPRARRALFALGAALVAALPLVPQLLGNAGRASSLAWTSVEEYPPWISAFFLTTPLAAAVLLAVVVAWIGRGDGRGPAVEDDDEGPGAPGLEVLNLALAFLLPSLLLGVVAITMNLSSLANARYGAAYLGVCALLLGWALTRPRSKGTRRLLAAGFLAFVALTMLAPSLASGRTFNLNAENEDWAGAARFVASNHRAGDLILLRAVLVESPRLFDGTLPPICAPYIAAPMSDFYLPPGAAVAVIPEELTASFAASAYGASTGRQASQSSRFWIVLAGAPDPGGYLDAVVGWLRDATHRTYRMQDARAFGPVSVGLLAPVD